MAARWWEYFVPLTMGHVADAKEGEQCSHCLTLQRQAEIIKRQRERLHQLESHQAKLPKEYRLKTGTRS